MGDLFAVILGVLFTVLSLDARTADPARHPNVAAQDFARWQRRTVSAYAPGSYACFFRVVFHFCFVRYVSHHPLSPLAFGRIGLLVDVVWLGSTVSTLVRAHFARELRKKLGIVLEKPAASG